MSADTLTLGSDLTLHRIGFGAMRLTGPDQWGVPADPEAAEDVVRRAVELGVDVIDTDVPVEVTHAFLRSARDADEVRHLGLFEVRVLEVEEAQEFFDVVSVQNRCSTGDRTAEPVLDHCRAQGTGSIPWFPLGGGDVGEHDALSEVALAWLLHPAENILLIPGTSSTARPEQNTSAGDLDLTAEQVQALDVLSAASWRDACRRCDAVDKTDTSSVS